MHIHTPRQEYLLWGDPHGLDQQIQLVERGGKHIRRRCIQQVNDGGIVTLEIGVGIVDVGIRYSSNWENYASVTGLCQHWNRDRQDRNDVIGTVPGHSLEMIEQVMVVD